MRKLSKFARSQMAHKRLENKHEKNVKNSKGRDYDIAFVGKTYHLGVRLEQQEKKRILTSQEKKKIFNEIISLFY